MLTDYTPPLRIGHDRFFVARRERIGVYWSAMNLHADITPEQCGLEVLNNAAANLFWARERYGVESAYGVADTVEQVLGHLSQAINDPMQLYVIELTEITRDTEPEEGGWTWQGLGPYIGVRSPQAQYLRDELGIDRVITFHLWEVAWTAVPASRLPDLNEDFYPASPAGAESAG
jgi:hypothetical protein